ncbi:MAG: 3-dehydroquinate synthase [Spirochaetes bacterium]|nr:3-dehydroquinate synthase [Spirochaetota bacterium]MBP9023640.1 3-dehydroquinate synthase [Spirochaetota bacterium]
MDAVKVSSKRVNRSVVHVGGGFASLSSMIDLKNTIIITETEVFRFYGYKFPSAPLIIADRGEACKTIDSIMNICEKLLSMNADRKKFILAIGGGALTDAVGFVSSIFLRGVRFGFVPTTLLSQVDASVGGKNGINFGGYKNMIGTINQPEFVLCDPSFFKTLSVEEYLSGLAEVIKHAVIKDKKYFDKIKNNKELILSRDEKFMSEIVLRSVEIKAGVVSRDETEQGERKLLNFGHTLGHAVEVLEKLPHGIAVGAGMNLAAEISRRLNFLSDEDCAQIRSLLDSFGYPSSTVSSADEIKRLVMKDKKREGEGVNFVLLNGIGKSFYKMIDVKKLEVIIDDMCRPV